METGGNEVLKLFLDSFGAVFDVDSIALERCLNAHLLKSFEAEIKLPMETMSIQVSTGSGLLVETTCNFSEAGNAVGEPAPSLHLNRALHWWCVGHRKIIAFDLATYEILSLDSPEEIKFGGYTGPWVPLFLDYQGSLFASGHKSIWVMKEYGNTQSWAKLSTSLPKEDAIPVSISRLGELVFRTADGLGLVKSDIEGRMSDDDKSRIIQFGSTFVFKESLISPVSIQKDDKLIGLALTDCN